MKFCVLVPSESYFLNAGARIRYGRLIEALSIHNVELQLIEIGKFNLAASDADVLLISKCHDARAQLVAIEARRRGIHVGVDLFDDYFSQFHDPRLTRFRNWLAGLAPWLSFALTSTEAMARVASRYHPGLPVHVVNDPATPGMNGKPQVACSEVIERKHRHALDQQELRIAWFGIGDNPYFSVGLSDVAAFAGKLAEVARLSKMVVRLTILTNARSLTANGLSQIAALPVAAEVQEWSEGAEATLLQDSLACFLPVNAQAFSAAKSLNRAITSLSAGCQLISAGYPLYAPLDEFLYRSVPKLVADLMNGDLRVSAKTRDGLVIALDQWANGAIEAEKLATFLFSLPKAAKQDPGKVALVHGASSSDPTNRLARAMGDMTVGSPYAPSNLDVDAWMRIKMPVDVEVSISEPVIPQLQGGAAASGGTVERGKKRFRLVTTPGEEPDSGPPIDIAGAGLGVQLAIYNATAVRIRDRLSADFGTDQVVWSENSAIPFSSQTVGSEQ
jgi:hypothetical protein